MVGNILAVSLMSLGMGLSNVKDKPKQNIIAENQLTDLTGSTWYFNATISTASDTTYIINFNSNNYSYNQIIQYSGTIERLIYKFYSQEEPELSLYDEVYTHQGSGGGGNLIKHRLNDTSDWLAEDYRTISITDGQDVSNSTLISWLYQNATLTDYPQDTSESSETSENSEPTPTPSSEGGMGADIIGGITSGLGIISPLALSFLSGFGALFWDATNQVLSPFAVFSLVMLGLAISFAIVKLVMHIIRSNTGA